MINNAIAIAIALLVGDLNSRRSQVVQVVERASPAVVSIGAVQVVQPRSQLGMEDLFLGSPTQRREVESLGSGVIFDSTGLIVTNEHVIRGASSIHVVLADGRQLNAEVVGSDADNDLAVLKVNAGRPLPTIRTGNSNELLIGETAIAIGSPLGLKKTVTVGVVSAVGRSFHAQDRVYNDFIQTDAAINPGNSGGPILNTDGELIGINTAIIASAQGIGFAIPVDKVQRIVAELRRFGKVRPAWIGIEVQPLSGALARSLGWDRTFGAAVSSVDPRSPAENAGVQRGDIVVQLGATQVEDADDLRSRLRGATAKTALPLKVFRKGQMLSLDVVPMEFPAQLVDFAVWERLGLKVSPSSNGMRITAVRGKSYAARIGLAPGDVVLRINNRQVPDATAFREAILEARGNRSALLLVGRGRIGYYVTLPF